MATVNKDFKIKSGLIVEGASGTINGQPILTEASTQFIIDTVGGSATSNNTPNTVVLRDGNGNFTAGTITADITGDVTGTVSDISNHNTDDLSEGTTNKYFTDARALSATASAYDAAGSASAAQTAAEGYADTVATNAYNNAVTAAANDATSKMQQAESYADQSALDAENAAKAYADSLATNYDAAGAATTAENNAKAYTDQEVAALVSGAPALLDTLNELAAAINDNPNYATDVANLVAGKQDTLTAGTGITIDGQTDTISVTANTYDAYGAASSAQTAAETYADGVALTAENNAKSYADGLATNYDAAGSATTAENNAKSYADSLAVNYDPAGAASSAETAANGYTDMAISNLNLSTTYDAYGAAATAETNANGYTDTAISNGNSSATPTYAGVNFSWATKQTGSYTYVATASIAQVFQWTGYPTAKFVVRVRAGVHSQVSEVLLTTDDNGNVAITEYGIVSTNGNLGNVSATYDAGTWNLTVETTENSSEVIVAATLMAYGD